MANTLTYWRSLLPLLCLSTCVNTAQAVDPALLAPAASRNLSPLYHSLGIPPLVGAQSIGAGNWQLDWSVHWASHALQEVSQGDLLELDGETRRQDLRLRLGLTDRLTLTVNLPYLQHAGGQLDSLIDDWHSLWDMPDGPRARQPRDALNFSFGGDPGFSVNNSRSGFGDAELGLAMELLPGHSWQLAAFARYKFDSGDAGDFTGSGDSGVALGARLGREACIFASLSCHMQIGIADVGDIAISGAAQQRVAFGGLALAWQLLGSLALTAQLDAHDVVYEQAPLNNSGAPVWGTLGLRWQPAERWFVEAQFSEDLAVGTAPDITFRLALSRRL
ncbi:MAG: hypothetical protein ACI87W_001041 [Halieaceae bacterium]|jgi:hypothetical protein